MIIKHPTRTNKTEKSIFSAKFKSFSRLKDEYKPNSKIPFDIYCRFYKCFNMNYDENTRTFSFTQEMFDKWYEEYEQEKKTILNKD